MTVKIGINGFGRIGRLVLRALCESKRSDVEVVGINDLGPVDTNAEVTEEVAEEDKMGTVAPEEQPGNEAYVPPESSTETPEGESTETPPSDTTQTGTDTGSTDQNKE